MKCLIFSLSSSVLFSAFVASKAVQKPGIDVKLSAVDSKAGIVKVSVKNTGPSAVNLFKRGTFLDAGPVRKIDAFSNAGKTASFLGIKTVVQMTNLTQDAFEHIEKGKSIQFTVNVAGTHDLSAGGTYNLQSSGLIPYADGFSTDLTTGKSISFKSNKLKLKVDGKVAAKAKPDYKSMKLAKRDDCGGNRGTVENALAMCSWMAANAANAAFNGDAGKFAEYFKTTDGGMRAAVGNRFNAIANECRATNGGVTQVGCTDWWNPPFCTDGVLSYTVSPDNRATFCPLFFTLPLVSSSCHRQDMATTTLHEMTHCPAVYSPETDDKAYGYDNDMRLSAGDAFLNADTYAMYANALYVGC